MGKIESLICQYLRIALFTSFSPIDWRVIHFLLFLNDKSDNKMEIAKPQPSGISSATISFEVSFLSIIYSR